MSVWTCISRCMSTTFPGYMLFGRTVVVYFARRWTTGSASHLPQGNVLLYHYCTATTTVVYPSTTTRNVHNKWGACASLLQQRQGLTLRCLAMSACLPVHLSFSLHAHLSLAVSFSLSLCFSVPIYVSLYVCRRLWLHIYNFCCARLL